MAEIRERVLGLHDALIHAYDHDDADSEERDAYIDTLKQYTSAVALAATHAFAQLVGIPSGDIQLVDLTDAQYRKLEASDMLDVYIDGKDSTDD